MSWIFGHHEVLLDIGCGPTQGDSLYSSKCDFMIALDVNRESFETDDCAEKTHPIIGDATALPVADGVADVVVATEVLEHVSSDEAMISEVYRVLKPEGQFIVTVPNDGPFGFLDPNRFSPARAVLKIVGKSSQIEHRHYSIEDVRLLLRDYFEVEEVYRTGFWVTGLCVLLVQFSKLAGLKKFESFFNRVGACDYRLEYGSAAHNLAISARKHTIREENRVAISS